MAHSSVWSDGEIAAWLRTLSTSLYRQRAIVYDLLSNAREDRMSGEDVAICVRGLDLVKRAIADHERSSSRWIA